MKIIVNDEKVEHPRPLLRTAPCAGTQNSQMKYQDWFTTHLVRGGLGKLMFLGEHILFPILTPLLLYVMLL